jgi:hypothetical protein
VPQGVAPQIWIYRITYRVLTPKVRKCFIALPGYDSEHHTGRGELLSQHPLWFGLNPRQRCHTFMKILLKIYARFTLSTPKL